MLEGLVAAGFYICFFGRRKGAVFTGIGTVFFVLAGILLPEIRWAVPLITALWIMLAGIRFLKERREESFLAGGVWLTAWSLAQAGWMAVRSLTERRFGGVLTPSGPEVSADWRHPAGMLLEDGLPAGTIFGEEAGLLSVGSLQTAIAAALLLMLGLYLLDRGKLYPMWMVTLTMLWLLTGYLGSIPYTKLWQQQAMTVSLYLIAAGMLACQQIICARQALKRAFWDGDGEIRQEEPWKAAASEKGTKAAKEKQDPDWQEAARREFTQLRIFEHDFRHHLDVLAALYEAGNPGEARAYIEDLKQFRGSRQGLRMGGERELTYMMMAKKEACRQAEISFSYQIVGSPGGITQMDMTALLLNLLDNAVRACADVPKPRSLSVMLLSRGELWEIEIIHSGRYDPETEGQNGWQRGADGAVHGVGLVSVRQITEKYQGTFRIWQEEGQVRQRLILVQRTPPET